jgi:hypothetical protein
VVPLSLSDLVVLTLLGLLVMVPVTIILALLGFKRSIRQSRAWRMGLPTCAGLVLLQLLLLMGHREVEHDYAELVAWHYTHHLSSPRAFDNIAFPAGATVVQSTWEPHSVSGGTVPTETVLLGLPVRGDFAIDFTAADDAKPYLSEGELTRAASVRDVPCAAGKFKHTIESSKETVACILSASHAIGGIVLPAGSDASVTWSTYQADDVEIYGSTPRDWSALGVHCAQGEFSYHGDFQCTPAGPQRVAGYLLADGHDVTVFRGRDGELGVSKGVLAEDIDVAGVRIPAGSTIDAVYEGIGIDATRLRAHDMDDTEYVTFELPKGVRLEAAGAVLQGDFVGIEVLGTSMRVHEVENLGTERTAIRDGVFEMATRRWQWEKVED